MVINMEEKDCKHENWLPNGTVSKGVYGRETDSIHAPIVKQGERVYASSICAGCGKIKIEEK